MCENNFYAFVGSLKNSMLWCVSECLEYLKELKKKEFFALKFICLNISLNIFISYNAEIISGIWKVYNLHLITQRLVFQWLLCVKICEGISKGYIFL